MCPAQDVRRGSGGAAWVCRMAWDGAAPEGEASVRLHSTRLLVRARAPSARRPRRRGAPPAVLPSSARAIRPLGASGPPARGSGGRSAAPGTPLALGASRTPPVGRRGAAVAPRAARSAPETGSYVRRGGRGLGPPPASARVDGGRWRVERAGPGDWRWERAVGVDCSAPEPRCVWLPCRGHRDRPRDHRAPGPRLARVSAGAGWCCSRVGVWGASHWGGGQPRATIPTRCWLSESPRSGTREWGANEELKGRGVSGVFPLGVQEATAFRVGTLAGPLAWLARKVRGTRDVWSLLGAALKLERTLRWSRWGCCSSLHL